MKSLTYRATTIACYMGYVTQAIAVNVAPLLFVTFQKEYGISLEMLGLLVTVEFIVQILVDLLATRLGPRLPYRTGAVLAHLFAVAGLVGLGVLPDLLPSAYAGVMISAILMSIGGGLIEVLISPMVDAIPGQKSAAAMSFLHSFYCWGVVAVVVLSTAFFGVFSAASWRWLPILWALVPAVALAMFFVVPIPRPVADNSGHATPLRKMLATPLFWLFMFLMLCAGAAELSVSQWASLFAESGLKVSKTVGDLLGPCAFALLMGLSRVVYGFASQRYNARRLLFFCGALCVAGYLLTVLAPWPGLSLVGFAIAGMAVGPFWPGLLSLGSQRFEAGGTAMFALLALCGDLGCSFGPGLVGAVSNRLQLDGSPVLQALQAGLGLAILFPVGILLGTWLLGRRQTAKNPLYK